MTNQLMPLPGSIANDPELLNRFRATKEDFQTAKEEGVSYERPINLHIEDYIDENGDFYTYHDGVAHFVKTYTPKLQDEDFCDKLDAIGLQTQDSEGNKLSAVDFGLAMLQFFEENKEKVEDFNNISSDPPQVN